MQGDDVMLRFEMTQYQRSEAEKKAMVPSDVDMKVKVRGSGGGACLLENVQLVVLWCLVG